MADITMCKNNECERRESCYCYTAPINEYWQPVFADAPRDNPCKYFWDNAGRVDGRKIGKWWEEGE